MLVALAILASALAVAKATVNTSPINPLPLVSEDTFKVCPAPAASCTIDIEELLAPLDVVVSSPEVRAARENTKPVPPV